MTCYLIDLIQSCLVHFRVAEIHTANELTSNLIKYLVGLDFHFIEQ